jgi:hypothetical protein
VVDSGGEVFQTTSAANSQGYTLANNYAPTTASGATVNQGLNATVQCVLFSPNSALCSGTSDGSSEMSGDNGLLANFPAIPMVSRLTSWDAGAYEFGTGSSGPNPPSGLVATVQ